MSAVDISQEQAQWLFAEGAILVFLDLPAGSEFGVDYCSWEVGERFKGVKMIPPGIHFIYYSAVSRQGQVAPRTGFMYNFQQRETLIKVWDPVTEDVKSESASAELQARIESTKQELDRYLGVYPYDSNGGEIAFCAPHLLYSYKKWVSLTDHISPLLLDQLMPLGGKIFAATPLQSEPSTTESRRAAATAAGSRESASTSVSDADKHTRLASLSHGDDTESDSRLPHMEPLPGSQIRFSVIPWMSHVGASPAEVTSHGMDRTATLDGLLASYAPAIGADAGMLGELQFAFVCFIIGQVYESFDAWKQLVHLLSSCVDAVSCHPQLYMQLLSVLHKHIAEIPEDFFVDIVSRNNFLTDALSCLFENIASADDRALDVKNRSKRFRAHLERKFNWDFGAETGEYAPVVVDLDT